MKPSGPARAALKKGLTALGLVLAACQPGGSAVTSTEPVTVPLGPAANGLIAYSYDGDIHVGDPVAGGTTRIVSGPESDINPIFSPDGTRIAFVRGTWSKGPTSLRVVWVVGSDERVVVLETPDGTQSALRGIGPFAWTPDGTGIVVEVDLPPHTGHHDGEIVFFDASGTEEPRLLTPPLTLSIGAIAFNPSAQLAPMFRPPDGDLILDGGERLTVFDADLASSRHLGGEFCLSMSRTSSAIQLGHPMGPCSCSDSSLTRFPMGESGSISTAAGRSS